MNSKSEFHQAPLVRVVALTGRGRGEEKVTPWGAGGLGSSRGGEGGLAGGGQEVVEGVEGEE